MKFRPPENHENPSAFEHLISEIDLFKIAEQPMLALSFSRSNSLQATTSLLKREASLIARSRETARYYVYNNMPYIQYYKNLTWLFPSVRHRQIRLGADLIYIYVYINIIIILIPYRTVHYVSFFHWINFNTNIHFMSQKCITWTLCFYFYNWHYRRIAHWYI